MVIKNISLPKLIVPIVTPCKNCTIDAVSLEKLITFQLQSGVEALFILGTTGEFYRMPLVTKQNLISIFYKIIANQKRRIYTLIGISAKKLTEMLTLIDFCAPYPADALVLTPMFGEGTPEEKLNLVLQKTSKPIMLYNNPAIQDKQNLPVAILKKFIFQPQVIGIKDSSGNQPYFESLLALACGKFHIYQGFETNLPHDLKYKNLTGLVSGTANVIPSVFHELSLRINIAENQKALLVVKEKVAKEQDYIKVLKKWLQHDGILDSDEVFSG